MTPNKKPQQEFKNILNWMNVKIQHTEVCGMKLT